MDMSYLPLGKDGCEDCRNLECYCDDCTKKILNAVNVESRPTKRAVDGWGLCGILSSFTTQTGPCSQTLSTADQQKNHDGHHHNGFSLT